MSSVREATFEVARQHGMTTWFGNPGSTEIPLLAELPDDMRYVLALHENAAVGAAAGYAIASDRPAMVSLHTTAGLGNAVNSVATARGNRAPLVVLVGQQDRRHLLAEPFLTGQLAGLAGDYPLEVFQPPRPQDVPGCVAQATHTAAAGRGPVLVIVPMGDWDEQTDEPAVPAPLVSGRASGVGPGDVTAIAALLGQADAPVLVTGAGADSAGTWDALVRLADLLDCPVFQEPFTARAGFPQDNPRFAGFLPAGRAGDARARPAREAEPDRAGRPAPRAGRGARLWHDAGDPVHRARGPGRTGHGRGRGEPVEPGGAAAAAPRATPARVPQRGHGRSRIRHPRGDRHPDGPAGPAGPRADRRRVVDLLRPGPVDRRALRRRRRDLRHGQRPLPRDGPADHPAWQDPVAVARGDPGGPARRGARRPIGAGVRRRAPGRGARRGHARAAGTRPASRG